MKIHHLIAFENPNIFKLKDSITLYQKCNIFVSHLWQLGLEPFIDEIPNYHKLSLLLKTQEEEEVHR